MKKIKQMAKLFLSTFALFFILIPIRLNLAAAPLTQVTWLGHAAFEVKTPHGQVLLIDPWVTNPMNPWTASKKNPLKEIKKADYILITHGHSDHVGEAVEIAKITGAQLITNFELGNNLVKIFGFPKNQAGIQNLINIGGQVDIANNEVSVSMTPAVHSSGLEHPKSHEMIYGGSAGGYLLKIKNGPTIYHSGDTAYFKDLELLAENDGPDLALLNIGGHFGMSPEMAVKAAVAVRAKLVIPHHFKTFPILTQSAEGFVQGLSKAGIPSRVMTPGIPMIFENNRIKGDSH